MPLVLEDLVRPCPAVGVANRGLHVDDWHRLVAAGHALSDVLRALLPQRVLHSPRQRVHGGTAVARLTHLRLQQNVFP